MSQIYPIPHPPLSSHFSSRYGKLEVLSPKASQKSQKGLLSALSLLTLDYQILIPKKLCLMPVVGQSGQEEETTGRSLSNPPPPIYYQYGLDLGCLCKGLDIEGLITNLPCYWEVMDPFGCRDLEEKIRSVGLCP